ncbi:hypothetical protein FVE85_0730 [Porphyridium purpureum]|uniref:Uncharacterized protein n=1 Tax=Porphyridium purpureum TaxID=35688 RepID=A0A5J4YZC9_PORPP|nr:hypothetical protein FVE85_0730 [Porphyridium purpureum]|eukprot:POR4688..scf208_2
MKGCPSIRGKMAGLMYMLSAAMLGLAVAAAAYIHLAWDRDLSVAAEQAFVQAQNAARAVVARLPTQKQVQRFVDQLPLQILRGTVVLGFLWFVYSLAIRPLLHSLGLFGGRRLSPSSSASAGTRSTPVPEHALDLLQRPPALDAEESERPSDRAATPSGMGAVQHGKREKESYIERHKRTMPNVFQGKLYMRDDGQRLGEGEPQASGSSHEREPVNSAPAVSASDNRSVGISHEPAAVTKAQGKSASKAKPVQEFTWSARGELLRAEREARLAEVEAKKAARREKEQERVRQAAEQKAAERRRAEALLEAERARREHLRVLNERLDTIERDQLMPLRMKRRRCSDQLRLATLSESGRAALEEQLARYDVEIASAQSECALIEAELDSRDRPEATDPHE